MTKNLFTSIHYKTFLNGRIDTTNLNLILLKNQNWYLTLLPIQLISQNLRMLMSILRLIHQPRNKSMRLLFKMLL